MEQVLSVLRKVIPPPIFRALQPAYHVTLAFLAALRYDFPSRRLTVIGVTGTDGKTTVVHLLHEIFAAAGYGVGSLSSLRFKINDGQEPNLLKMTMPGRFRLQRFLAECRAARCRYVILEVTSQGILQFRHRFIRFSAAVFTNISPEHIEAHGGFEAYRRAKVKLFHQLPASGWAVLNREDASAEFFSAATRAQRVWYSRTAVELNRARHAVRLKAAEPERIELEVADTPVAVGLGGAFNVMNIIAAAAAALAFGVSPQTIAQALGRIRGVPGRLEFVQREPFAVVVDYANTPKAYEAVYRTLQEARLICVFGAPGGGRDRWKRSKLGEIASRYCRGIILTSDDAEDEDPAAIMEEIAAGVSNYQFSIFKIVDRREAIRTALEHAKPGDTVIITGMGAQPWLMLKGGKIPWDDRKIVREELARLTG